jgi:hypothetical protein
MCVRCLCQFIVIEHAASNVAYNAVCFLHKLLQIFHAKNIWLNRRTIVPAQHVVEYGCDIHCGVVQ